MVGSQRTFAGGHMASKAEASRTNLLAFLYFLSDRPGRPWMYGWWRGGAVKGRSHRGPALSCVSAGVGGLGAAGGWLELRDSGAGGLGFQDTLGQELGLLLVLLGVALLFP